MTLVLIGWARLAAAQSAGGFSVEPTLGQPSAQAQGSAEAGTYETTVKSFKPSPRPTQDRLFPVTRFWLLDPGNFEVQLWWKNQYFTGGKQLGLGIAKLQFGLTQHLQVDFYQNFALSEQGYQGLEGNQLELRYAFGRFYNDLPLNPVIYLQWHPRRCQSDRAEMRVLVGGDLGPRAIWAVNLYLETAVTGLGRPLTARANANTGASVATSIVAIDEVLRVGAEVQAGVDQRGTTAFHPVLMLGPSLIAKIPALNVKLTSTVLFGTMPKDPRAYPYLILAKLW